MTDHGVPVPPNSRPIPGYPGYAVSADGVVYSRWLRGRARLTESWRVMKQKRLRQRPYLRVGLTANGIQTVFDVHRLVLLAFVGPRPDDSPHTRHLDGDPLNNRLENLVYGTVKENCQDTARHGHTLRGPRCHSAKLTEAQVSEIRRRYAAGATQRPLAREYGVSQPAIGCIVRGKTWKHVRVD